MEVKSDNTVSETYIKIDVKGKCCCALVDSGSERSLIPRRLVASVPLKPTDIELFAANETPIKCLGTMVLRYCIGDQELQTELIATDDVDELIFGYDWLVEHE